MRNLGLFAKDTKINFLKYHKIYLLSSLVLVCMFLVYVSIKGLNLGVDFKGGTVITVLPTQGITTVDEVKTLVKSIKNLDVSFQQFKNSQTLQITINESNIQQDRQVSSAIDSVRTALKDKVTIVKTEFVGPHVSTQLMKSGVVAVSLALLGIFVYVWLRFNWQYSFLAILALLHDVIISVGMLTIFSYEVNISTIAAVLTIIGYSINDTIITFNQVKENVLRYPEMDNITLLNQSLNNVISRTISTSITVALVLLSVYLLGGDTLTSFSFTLLMGVIFGTYSSIFVSVPALLYFGNFRAIKLSSGHR